MTRASLLSHRFRVLIGASQVLGVPTVGASRQRGVIVIVRVIGRLVIEEVV